MLGARLKDGVEGSLVDAGDITFTCSDRVLL